MQRLIVSRIKNDQLFPLYRYRATASFVIAHPLQVMKHRVGEGFIK